MLTSEVDAMLRAREFWLAVVLGIIGALAFVLGAWIKHDFRGRALDRWFCRFYMAQGVFTLALAVYLMLQPLNLRFPYDIALEAPLLFVGLTATGIMFYCLSHNPSAAHPSIRGSGPNGGRGE